MQNISVENAYNMIFYTPCVTKVCTQVGLTRHVLEPMQ